MIVPLLILQVLLSACSLQFGLNSFDVPSEQPESETTIGSLTVNGRINSMAALSDGSRIYAGLFNGLVAKAGSCQQFNDQTDSFKGICDLISGPVVNMASDGQGGYFYLGYMTVAGSSDVHHLIHINSSGAVDTAFPKFDPEPVVVANSKSRQYEMKYHNGVLYFGGSFEQVGDEERIGLAAINVSTHQVTSWNPGMNTPDEVQLEILGDKLVVLGNFDEIGTPGTANAHLTAVSLATGAVDPAWVFDWDTMPLWPEKMKVYKNVVLVGDGFQVMMLNSDGTLRAWNANDGGSSTEIYDFKVVGDSLWVAGWIDSLYGVATQGLARFDLAPVSDTVDPQISPWSLTIDDGDPLVFEILGATSTKGLIVLNGDLVLFDWTNKTMGAVESFYAFSQPSKVLTVNDKFVILGSFTTRYQRNGLFMTTASGELSPWNPNADGNVSSVVVYNDKIFVGGEFDYIGQENPVARSSLAQLDRHGEVVAGWEAPKIRGGVHALKVAHGSLYAGGDISEVDDQPQELMARFSLSDGSWIPWVAAVSGRDVLAIEFLNDRLIVGGDLDDSLVALDAETGAKDATWSPAPSGTVNSIVVAGQNIYVGGYFDRVSGVTKNGIAQLTLASSLPTSWQASIDFAPRSMILVNNTIYMNGVDHFEKFGNAILDPQTGAVAEATGEGLLLCNGDESWIPN